MKNSLTLPHFQPHPAIPFLLPPPRINLYYKFSIFPSNPFFLHFEDLSGDRKLHSPYCFLPGGLGIPLLRKCQRSAFSFVLCLPPHSWWCWCQGFRQSSGLGRAEVATTAVAGTLVCSQLMLVIVQFQGQLGTLPGILFPEPQDDLKWCHLVSQSCQQENWGITQNKADLFCFLKNSVLIK